MSFNMKLLTNLFIHTVEHMVFDMSAPITIAWKNLIQHILDMLCYNLKKHGMIWSPIVLMKYELLI